MRTKLLGLFLFISITFSSCRQSQGASKEETTEQETSFSFNSDSLLTHIKTLSSDAFEGRQTGTRGSEKARHYIIDELKSLNVKPLLENYEQSFSFQSDGKTYNGSNILSIVPGTSTPKKYIVISAHYDHEGIKNGEIYNGADDNASGVGGLMAFAEYFKKNPPKHSVVLAFFDAEELGLEGSEYYVEHSKIDLNAIVLNINMDMISRNDANELYVSGVKSDVRLNEVEVISSFISSEDLTLLTGHDGSDDKQDWTYSSDHGSFHNKNIPYLYFGVEDHKDYHKPTDDFENIDPKFYKHAVQTIISAFGQLDNVAF